MAKKNKLPLLGALAATPVMTASVAQAQTFDVGSPVAIVSVAALAQAAALKLQLLTLTPGEKLSIAGDRLGGKPSTEPAAGLDRNGGSGGRGASPSTGRTTWGPPCTARCPKGITQAKPLRQPAGKPMPEAGKVTATNCNVGHGRPQLSRAATTPPTAAGAGKGRAIYCSGVASPKVVQAGKVDRRLTPSSGGGKCVANPLVKGAGQGKVQASGHSAACYTMKPLVKGSGQSKGPTAAASAENCAPK